MFDSVDPVERMTISAVADHAWLVGEEGPLPQYSCWCKRNRAPEQPLVSDGSIMDTLI